MKSAMGPSGYREKNGSSDEAHIQAVRAYLDNLSDQEILAVIGWSVKPEASVLKFRKCLNRGGTAEQREPQPGTNAAPAHSPGLG